MSKIWRFVACVFACALSAAVVAPRPAYADDAAAETYYSSQLTGGAKAIYDKLVQDFEAGKLQDGVSDVDITDVYVAANPEGLKNYVTQGNRQLFEDFSSAKDAFDLEHPEAWYIDSSFLTLRTGKTGQESGEEAKDYKALIGPGRADNYYLNGQKTYKTSAGKDAGKFDASLIKTMDENLKNQINSIVETANRIQMPNGANEETRHAMKIRSVHDSIIKNISYRFENEVSDAHPENSLFVRTAYGLVTHEGMCEAYARAFQEAMNELDIPCVLIAGMQTSGDNPEQHMWVYVDLKGNGEYVSSEREEEEAENHAWYGIDVTWDDPVQYNEEGKLVTTRKNAEGLTEEVTDGVDGRETSRYLLVGSNTLSNWAPAGQFSQDGKTFVLPSLSKTDYSGGEAFSQGGLSVKYSSTAAMEDNTAAGTFTVSYNGLSAREAAEEQGVYLLIKMIDLQDDGTVYTTKSKEGDEWYYAEASLAMLDIASGGEPNPFFCDVKSTDTTDEKGNSREPGEGYLKVTTSGCDYVEFAVTTQKPATYDSWWNEDWRTNALVTDTSGLSGYYRGDDSGVLNQTGELYNVNGTYSSQPYVYTQTPPSNSQVSTGTHMAKVIYDDALTFKGSAKLIEDAIQWDDSSANPSDIKKLKPETGQFTLSEDEKAFQKEQNDRFVTYTDAKGETKEYIRVPESEAHFTKGQNLGVWGTESGKSSKDSGTHGEGTNTLQVAYKCYQKDVEGNYLEHTLQGKVAFDDNEEDFRATSSSEEDHSSRNWNELTNADGFVDADTPHFNWIFECNIDDPNHKHVPFGQAVTSNNRLDPGKGCRLVGVEFEFDASEMWADDLTHYQFQIVGASTNPEDNNCVVGMRSSKPANTWQYLISSPMCPFAYASMGIDFSLWARPSLMDNPNDLDLSQFTATDRNGNEESLQELADQMNLDYINGKLMLVVEDLSNKRGQVSELEDQLEADQSIPDEAIKARSVYDLNFANICKSTISKVKKGAEEGDVSMRVQVGFPPGYGPEDAGVVFKAYHFDRDENGKVTDVQEIPVVVTEYGLLIMCNRFSPFEIVALDETNPQVQNALQENSLVHNNDLLVSSDGHVKVEANGKDVTVGDAAIVHMHDDENRNELKEGNTVFTLTPDDGYEIQGVTFNGGVKEVTPAEDGKSTVTITQEDLKSVKREDAKMGTNTILAVTAIPKTIKQQNDDAGMKTEMVATCNHQGTVQPFGNETKQATCTDPGHIQGQKCSKCQAIIVPESDTPAIGHTAASEQTVTEAPTCTEAGKMAEVKCKICKVGTAIAAQSIPAKGHQYDAGGVCQNMNGDAPCGIYSFEKDTILPNNVVTLAAGYADEGNFKEDEYTPETWAKYAEANAKAHELVSTYKAASENKNADGKVTAQTKADVVVATQALADAETNLVKKPTDFSALENLVAEFREAPESAYTEQSYKAFKQVFDEAQNMLSARTASQDEVDAMVKKLTDATNQLDPAPKPADKAKLTSEVERLSKENGGIYTEDTWAKFQEALASAQNVLNDSKATQDAVNTALANLLNAEGALKVRPVETPSTAALDEIIKNVEALDETLYDKSTFGALTEAISAAKEAIAKGGLSLADIDRLAKAITDAQAALKPAPVPEKADKAELQGLVDKVKSLNAGLYTPDTWKPFADALAKATDALAGEPSADELSQLYKALAEAEQGLKFIEIEKPSRIVIDTLVEDIEELDSSIYTPETWGNLQTVLNSVKTELQRDDLTADDITNLYTQLQKAFDALSSIQQDPGTVDPEHPLGPNEPGGDIPGTDKPAVDKSKLQALVDECNKISKNGYTFDSLYRFIVALRNANNGLIDDYATQGRIDRLYNALVEARDGLVEQLPKQPVQTTESEIVYRLYNQWSGEHLFTTDENEKNIQVGNGWTYEGEAWKSPKHSSTPVYRVYNPWTGEHHYTTDAHERAALLVRGWNAEGIAWYSDVNQGKPVYRLFNPWMNGAPGSHHYTTDKNEFDVLPTHGWNQEGVGWYALAA